MRRLHNIPRWRGEYFDYKVFSNGGGLFCEAFDLSLLIDNYKEMKSDKKLLNDLIEKAAELGLSEQDIKHAKDFLEYNEYFLCFDQIVTQMYEYDILIDSSFYDLVQSIAKNWKLDEKEYSCLKENLRIK